jgi:3-hydroxybutyryl-CoA dehydrogenase
MELEESLDDMIRHFSITEEEKKIYLSIIDVTPELERMNETDLVFECVGEKLEIKKNAFRLLDRILEGGQILASNTSTLSITELAAATHKPERVIGIHFISPNPNGALVELVRGQMTSDETMAAGRDIVRAMRKEAIEVFEYPGYVSSRLVIPLMNEALYLLMEGVANAEDIDKAMTQGYNFPMGPLEMADRFGLDQVLGMMDALFNELGELKYRPCPLLRKRVRAGQLGLKTGRGIFEYKDGQRVVASAQEE